MPDSTLLPVVDAPLTVLAITSHSEKINAKLWGQSKNALFLLR
jgi:hypothetical protein